MAPCRQLKVHNYVIRTHISMFCRRAQVGLLLVSTFSSFGGFARRSLPRLGLLQDVTWDSFYRPIPYWYSPGFPWEEKHTVTHSHIYWKICFFVFVMLQVHLFGYPWFSMPCRNNKPTIDSYQSPSLRWGPSHLSGVLVWQMEHLLTLDGLVKSPSHTKRWLSKNFVIQVA